MSMLIFYFVHSYYCAPEDSSVTAAVCDYGQPFCASVLKDNLFATQFHPEKVIKMSFTALEELC